MLEINKIYCGDCLEVMKNIEDKSIDCIICDLPYGTTACHWDTVIPFEPLWKCYKRIIKDNGAICLFGSQPFTTDLINSNREMFKYDLCWYKDKPADFGNSNIKPLRYHESILVFYKQKPTYNKQFEKRKGTGNERAKYPINYKQGSEHKFGMKSTVLHYNKRGRMIGTVIELTTGRRGEVEHPTVKPTELYKHLIKTYTNENDLILDNCSGSGTLAIASHNLKRNFICIEKDPEYHRKSVERYNKHILQERIF